MSKQDADDAGAAYFREHVRGELVAILQGNGLHWLRPWKPVASVATINKLVALVVHHRAAGHDDGLAQGAANERMG